MKIEPYLFFNGRAEEAAEFYSSALGAEVVALMRMRDSPEPQPDTLPPGSEDKVMHMNLKIGDTMIMGSDGCCAGEAAVFQGFSLSITVANEAEADRVFNALADGGQVQMPLAKTFWSPRFGMVVDRFGVGWMVIVLE